MKNMVQNGKIWIHGSAAGAAARAAAGAAAGAAASAAAVCIYYVSLGWGGAFPFFVFLFFPHILQVQQSIFVQTCTTLTIYH